LFLPCVPPCLLPSCLSSYMLRELHISNLAVISDVRIEFDPGLNCFTGSTGAGKSLVIGALEVLLGLRSPAEMLRPGADEGRVSGVFDVRQADMLRAIERLTDSPIAADGGELLLTRRLYASGRSSISLNGNPITLGEQQLELYRFQAEEIDHAELDPGEYEELSARASILKNLEKLTKDASATHAALYQADGSVLERLKMMAAVIAELSTVDENLQ